jgi:hypothetical protein
VYVLTNRAYYKLAQSTATVTLPPTGVAAQTANDATSPSPGTRRWCRLWMSAPEWQTQATWHIGAGGDDQAEGYDISHKLASIRELEWRLAGRYSRSLVLYLGAEPVSNKVVDLDLVPVSTSPTFDAMTITAKAEAPDVVGNTTAVVSYVYTGATSPPVLRVNDPAPGYTAIPATLLRITTPAGAVRYAWVAEDLGVVSAGTRDYAISFVMNDTTFVFGPAPIAGDVVEGLAPLNVGYILRIHVPVNITYPELPRVRYEMLAVVDPQDEGAFLTYCLPSANTNEGTYWKYRCCAISSNTLMRARRQEYEYCLIYGGAGVVGMNLYGERADFSSCMTYATGITCHSVSFLRFFDGNASFAMTSGVCVDLLAGSHMEVAFGAGWNGGGNQNSVRIDRGSRCTVLGFVPSVACSGDAVVSDGATAVATWAAFSALPTPRAVVSSLGSYLTD